MSEQSKAPAASFLGNFQVIKEKLSYLFVILVLCGILKLGHMTHWTFQFGEHDHEAEHAEHKDSKSNDAKVAAKPAEPVVEKPAAEPSLNGAVVEVSKVGIDNAGVEVGAVTRSAVQEEISTNAMVDYDQTMRAQLSSRASGYVWKVLRRVGESVRKGEVLVIIDSSTVGEAKADLLQSVVMSELKESNFKRLTGLQEGVAGRMILEAEMELRLAEIKTRNAIQRLVNLGLPLSLSDLQGLSNEQLTRYVQFLGIPEELTAQLDARNTTANLVPLVAPFDGVVIGHEITKGEAVSLDKPFLEVADTRRMWVMLEVRKEHANQLQMGQPVQFETEGMYGSVLGQIDWISSEVDFKTRTLSVRADVENPLLKIQTEGSKEQPLLRANTYGTGKIRIRSSKTALVVPRDAVQFTGAKNYVFVKTPEGFRRTDVELGVVMEEKVEVLSGLQDGDMVATTGSHVLKAEMQIATAQK